MPFLIASIDLTVVEFVHIFEADFTSLNSHIQKRTKNTFVRQRVLFFFGLKKCSYLAQFFKMGEPLEDRLHETRLGCELLGRGLLCGCPGLLGMACVERAGVVEKSFSSSLFHDASCPASFSILQTHY